MNFLKNKTPSAQKFKQLNTSNTINDKKSHSFSIIEVWDDESFGSPEDMSEVANFWNTLSKIGCTSLALVFSNSVQQILFEHRLPDIAKVFSDREDALLWVNRNKSS